ncbi:MAG TPA: hypothetical protein PKO33_07970, partial [Pyrinomonadaceae bacterium]|nr:hypothetical protein [Pyrinomonadaceae bacterium]
MEHTNFQIAEFDFDFFEKRHCFAEIRLIQRLFATLPELVCPLISSRFASPLKQVAFLPLTAG